MQSSVLKQYALPAIFAFSVAGYFAPFYLQITPTTPIVFLYIFVGLLWVLLFSTLWLYSIAHLAWAYFKGVVTRPLIFGTLGIWVAYGVWFLFAANGYLVTV